MDLILCGCLEEELDKVCLSYLVRQRSAGPRQYVVSQHCKYLQMLLTLSLAHKPKVYFGPDDVRQLALTAFKENDCLDMVSVQYTLFP